MDDRRSPRDGHTGRADPARIETVLCDLDGVVWLAHEPIAGSVEAVAELRAGGRRVLFVTNNSVDTEADQVGALGAIGIDAAGDVVTSAMAAASLLRPDDRVLVVGGPGIVEAAVRARATPHLHDEVDDETPLDAVIVGLDRRFDFPRLRRAAGAVRRGARLIATNSDATFPTPRGPEPGGGAIVAAVATAAGATPLVAGKPHRPMADLIGDLLGGPGRFDPSRVLMVGDRPETDGRFAATLGCPYALVRSGVVPPGAPVADDVQVAIDLPDLAGLAAHLAPSSISGD